MGAGMSQDWGFCVVSTYSAPAGETQYCSLTGSAKIQPAPFSWAGAAFSPIELPQHSAAWFPGLWPQDLEHPFSPCISEICCFQVWFLCSWTCIIFARESSSWLEPRRSLLAGTSWALNKIKKEGEGGGWERGRQPALSGKELTIHFLEVMMRLQPCCVRVG